MKQIKSDDLISRLLIRFNEELGGYLKGDVVTIKSPIDVGLDDAIRYEIENLHEGTKKKRGIKLVVILETNGGYIEVVERIYNVFRKHYDLVDFIVPNFAYSAGTVLVLSGDEIYMDYYSVLGPIDPQVRFNDGRFLPGIGYLQKFNELVKLIDEASDPGKLRAEMAFLINKFEPATLSFIEQSRDHSISLLESWLPRHKFKNWNKKETSGGTVTTKDKKDRAKEIANILGDPNKWHSHGRGIDIKSLTSDDIKLKINNFGTSKGLNDNIRKYYDLLVDYCIKLGITGINDTIIHSYRGLRRLNLRD